MAPRIHKRNLRDEFEVIKTLDAGDGHGPGALNGGIHVVRRKADGLVCVEKRIAPPEIVTGTLLSELIVLRGTDHRNITRYIDAFICLNSQPPAASLYMEYCQLGSIDDLIHRYRQKSHQHRYFIPEPFIWHTFHSLLKALTYLKCGAPDAKNLIPQENWVPSIHRDIKPANIFIRHADMGGMYPAVVLGDFGLAISKGHHEWGKKSACGTFWWQPPEIPEHDIQGRGDVWAVGAVIHAMCRLDNGPMDEPPPHVNSRQWEMNPRARKSRGAGSHYSPALNQALSMALTLNKRERPDAVAMTLELRDLFPQAPKEFKELPDWAFG